MNIHFIKMYLFTSPCWACVKLTLPKVSAVLVVSEAENLRFVDAETLSAIAAMFTNRNEGRW